MSKSSLHVFRSWKYGNKECLMVQNGTKKKTKDKTKNKTKKNNEYENFVI